MKRQRRGTILLLVVLLVILLLAGCLNSGGEITQNSPANEDTNPIWDFKYDPPITITTAIVDENRPNAFKPGESLTDNVHTRWMEENLGIVTKFDWIVSKFDDADTKIRLALAVNGKLPDTFNADGDILKNLLQADKLLPLDDAIEKYAHPRLKEALEKYAYTLTEVTKDGKIYGLPHFSEGDEGTVMWIRKDWLEKLSLDPPTTISQLENVLKAFSEQDPNGNGLDDEVGLAVPLKEGPWSWMGQTDAIAGAFSGQMLSTFDIKLFWNENENGSLVYGAVQPDAKKYLETMSSWMAKGYMDREAGMKDPSKASEMAVNGMAGVMFGPFWMGAWPLGDTVKVDAEANWQAFPLPAGPDGLKGKAQKPLYGIYTVFSKDFKNMEAWFSYYNKVLAKNFGPEDPYFDPRFANGFHEGYDYVIKDDNIITVDFEAEGVPNDKWPLADGSSMDMRWMLYPLTGGAPALPYMNADAIKKMSKNSDAEVTTPIEQGLKGLNSAQLTAAGIAIAEQELEIPNQYHGPLTDGMEKNGVFLQKLVTESYLSIIYGEKPLSYFDEFVAQFYKNGGDVITKEVNDWYNENKP
ncbi:putative aldouronate transport system substrate-binding protein [Paenibacillus anaericanus]|uniref:extracellular solute-binding protein n=1 Tax=Paenibacillus anaericanus TaxID=170367 RepID=UPI0027830D73|nr:extracellular solute-binding protein [Paenibacillus anaericanus]MDQ0088919.1 putative aldouronate transport system substrate-binding protein [Paenibacillus anaericanus]